MPRATIHQLRDTRLAMVRIMKGIIPLVLPKLLFRAAPMDGHLEELTFDGAREGSRRFHILVGPAAESGGVIFADGLQGEAALYNLVPAMIRIAYDKRHCGKRFDEWVDMLADDELQAIFALSPFSGSDYGADAFLGQPTLLRPSGGTWIDPVGDSETRVILNIPFRFHADISKEEV